LVNLHKKDREHFGTAEGTVDPLEAIFMTLDFKPFVGFRDICGNKQQCQGLFRDIGGVWGGAFGTHDGGNYIARSSHGIAQEVHDSTCDGGMEMVRESSVEHDQVCWF